jgi:hypothetical protein
LAIGLAIITFLLYAPVSTHAYIDYDDGDYVFDNPHVSGGISFSSLQWALTTGHAANWHPVTWISHMLDCQLFGLNPGPQHVVSAVIHAFNAALLFLLLTKMTGRARPSAIVAALFAWHPIHVESVAWIAERKDLLSTFFAFLALLTYQYYVRLQKRRWYLLTTLFFALGLMAKPMIVTLPCLMLLLDYWPLERFGSWKQLLRLGLEKVPLFALSGAASVITMLVQGNAGAIVSVSGLPLAARVENALLSYARYIGKIFWPQGLMLPYVYGLEFTAASIAGAAFLLITLSAAALWARQWFKYPFVGWFWFLGTLIPVIGIVQVGIQSMADRYTYMPSIGLFVIVSWGFEDAFQALGRPRFASCALIAGTLVISLTLTSLQLRYWRDSEKLFFHSIITQPFNLPAMDCLAWTYATDPNPRIRDAQKALRLASACVRDTDRLQPDFLMTLSAAYAENRQFSLATQTAEEALQLVGTSQAPEFTSKARARIELYKADKAIRTALSPSSP